MKNIVYIIIAGIITGFPSCKNPERLFEEYIVPNGLTYPAKAMNVTAHPGKERIQISWQNGVDPEVVKARIFWNNYTDSVEVAIPAGADVINQMIEPMNENTYSFMVRTYDNKGNISIPVEVIGVVYGEIYESSLVNRRLKSRLYDGRDLTLEWDMANETETGVNLSYTDVYGINHSMIVNKSESITHIPDFDPDKPLFYNTMYKPDSMAIDMFFAQMVETMIDPNILIPNNTWAEYILPGDIPPVAESLPLRLIWDGVVTGTGFHSAENIPLPCVISWDLGVKVILNRMKLWPRDHNDDRWKRGHPRVFEIYGSLDEPDQDGSLDNWIPLGRFECVKPSPGADITQADIDFANAGIDFDFVSDAFADPFVPVRYIRFRCISNFRGETEPQTTPLSILEISFWGKIVE